MILKNVFADNSGFSIFGHPNFRDQQLANKRGDQHWMDRFQNKSQIAGSSQPHMWGCFFCFRCFFVKVFLFFCVFLSPLFFCWGVFFVLSRKKWSVWLGFFWKAAELVNEFLYRKGSQERSNSSRWNLRLGKMIFVFVFVVSVELFGDVYVPKWPLFWLEKAFSWMVKPPK